jgi:hypothetical protein
MSKIFSHLLVGLMLLVWPINVRPQTPAMSHLSRPCAKERQGCRRKRRASIAKSISREAVAVNNTTRASAAQEPNVAGQSDASKTRVEPAPSKTATQEAATAGATPSAPLDQFTAVDIKSNADLARDVADYVARKIQAARLTGSGYDRLLAAVEKLKGNPSSIESQLSNLIGPPGTSLRACRFYLLMEQTNYELTPEKIKELSNLSGATKSTTKSCPRILEGILC